MNIIKLEIGGAEWLKKNSASEAAAMLGISKYTTRSELLRYKATGIKKEVSPETQKLFERGHLAEKMARALIEDYINDDLYVYTGETEVDGLTLSASFDGITEKQLIIFEHKLLNNDLRIAMQSGCIPAEYHPQLEQQLIVSDANEVLFVASNCITSLDDEHYIIPYSSDPDLRSDIIAGWKQFNIDLKKLNADFEKNGLPEPEEIIEKKRPRTLPLLSIEISGQVSSTNLDTYNNRLVEILDNINTELNTDDDFAQAEADIKFCNESKKQLDHCKNFALSQVEDIFLLFQQCDFLKNMITDKGTLLTRQVKAKKQDIKERIIFDSNLLFKRYLDEIKRDLDGHQIKMNCDPIQIFSDAIKNKRSRSTMQASVDAVLANLKITASYKFDSAKINLDYYNDNDYHKNYKFLFGDLTDLLAYDLDNFKSILQSRVNSHQKLVSENEQQQVYKPPKKEKVIEEYITISKSLYKRLCDIEIEYNDMIKMGLKKSDFYENYCEKIINITKQEGTYL